MAKVASDGLVGWVWRWSRGLRLGRRGGDRRMEVLEVLSLGGRKQLTLVRCGEKTFLVGSGADSVGSIVAVDVGERL